MVRISDPYVIWGQVLTATFLTVAGLMFDIAGAFFLGVEAIRIKNISFFKEYILKRLYSHSLSPRLFFRGDIKHNISVAQLGPRLSETWPSGLFQGLHYIAGFLLLVFSNYLSNGYVLELFIWFLDWFLNLHLVIIIVFGILLLIVFVAAIWGLGEIIHVLITKCFLGSIKFVEFIEAKTPKGTVGVIGFLLLLIGFSLQAVGAVVSAIK